VLDTVADARGLADRDPAIGQKMDNIAGVRKEHDAMSQYTTHGRKIGFMGNGEYQHVARIPDGVMSALLAIKPDFIQDGKSFYRWLARHPEYRAYKPEVK